MNFLIIDVDVFLQITFLVYSLPIPISLIVREKSFEAESCLVVDLPIAIFDRPDKFSHEVVIIRADQLTLSFEVIATGNSLEDVVVSQVLDTKPVLFTIFKESS